MALTITQEPPALALAGNPMKFTVHSDEYEIAAAAKSIITFDALGPTVAPLPNGDEYFYWFKFNYGTFRIFLSTAEADLLWSADPSLYWNIPFDSTLTGSTYAETLALFFGRLSWIEPYWNVSVVSGQVVFESKEYSSLELIEIIAGDINSPSGTDPNPIMSIDTGNTSVGNQGEVNPYLELTTELYIEEEYGTSTYTLLREVNQQLSASDISVDVAPYLKAYFDKKSLKDSILTANPVGGPEALHDTNKRYYVKFTANSINDFGLNHSTTSSIKKAMKGGLKKNEAKLITDIASYFTANNKIHLSWSELGTTLADGEVKNIYSFNPYSADAQVLVKVDGTYADGSSTTQMQWYDVTIPPYSLFKLNIPYPAAGVGYPVFPDGYDFVKIRIRFSIINSADPLNQYIDRYTTIQMREKEAIEREIFYENSFSAFEALNSTARAVFGTENEKEEVNKPLDTVTGDYETVAISKGFDEFYEANTGNLSAKESIALIDMLNSNEVYIKVGDELIRINVEAGNKKLYADDAYPHGFPFKFTVAEKNRYYSNIFNQLP